MLFNLTALSRAVGAFEMPVAVGVTFLTAIEHTSQAIQVTGYKQVFWFTLPIKISVMTLAATVVIEHMKQFQHHQWKQIRFSEKTARQQLFAP